MIAKYPVPPPGRETRAEFLERLTNCSHRWELRRYECSNGAVQFKRQCTLCGESSPAIAHKDLSDAERANAPRFDPDLRNRIYEVARQRWQMQHDREQSQFSSRWWAWYDQYRTTAYWAERRRLVLERAGGRCEACGKERACIAHHLTYANVGQEPLYDLVAVCESCHADLHKNGGNNV